MRYILILLIFIYIIWIYYGEFESFKNYDNDVDIYLTKLLNKTVQLLNKNNIDYWLECGTLLGAIRNNDFIHNDTDIDISIYEKDSDKLEELINKDDEEGLKIVRKSPYSLKLKKYKGKETSNNIKNEPYIDIYMSPYKPLICKYKFKDFTYNIPGKDINDTKEYLKIMYGNCEIPSDYHAPGRNVIFEKIKKNPEWYINNIETPRINNN